jgi:hypothetical protein
MKITKFWLADILSIIALLVFGFFCFLSINFISLGDTGMSIIGAALISLLLGSLAFGLKLLKRTIRKFKTFIIIEWVLIFLFIITAFLTIIPFSHYFTVSKNKSEIQKDVFLNIIQAERIFSNYEIYSNTRLKLYESQLKSVVKNIDGNRPEYNRLGFNDPANDDNQIQTKLKALRFQLYPSNYLDMKKIDSIWLSDSKSKIKNWSPTGIVKVINTYEKEINSWVEQLNYYSTYRADGEDKNSKDFNFETNFDNVSSKITEQKPPSLFSIILSFVLYIIILLSYFVTNRSSKSKFTLFYFISKENISKDDEIDVKF